MVPVPVSRLVRLFAIILPLVAVSLASAAPGDLDVTFNPAGTAPFPGVATFDVSNAHTNDGAVALVILPSGRIVVAVNASECVLLAVTPGGLLDTGFGSGTGKVVVENCSGLVAMKLQPPVDPLVDPPQIVVIHSQGVLRRFNADGSVDAGFGAVTSPVGAGPLAIQSNRKVVVAGLSGSGTVSVARFLPNGLLEVGGPLDTSFSMDGVTSHDFGLHLTIGAVAVQADGAIVVGGARIDDANAVDSRSPMQFFVARFTSLGVLDSDFSGDGWTTTDFDGEELRALAVPALDPLNSFRVLQSGVTGLVIQGGRIVAVGGTQANVDDGDTANPGASLGSHRDFVLMARYENSGALDVAFGNTSLNLDGKAYGPLGYAEDVAVQGDGKIVASGFIGRGVDGVGLFGVARFSANGVLDSTFGTGGTAATDLTGPPIDRNTDFSSALAVGIQPNGKIVAAGAASQDPTLHPEDLDTRVVRYRGDSDSDDDGNGDGDTTPPTITSARATPRALWPPLHQMVTVRVNVTATDPGSAAAPTCAITQIQSSQPIDSPGPLDGHTSPDYVITGPLTARLRAEISLSMGRRTYTLTVRCQDAAGNAATTAVPVIVTLLPPALLGF